GIGWEPQFIGSEGEGREKICLGLWPFGAEIRETVARNAGLDPLAAAPWFDASFPDHIDGEAA
ncbi:MAG: autoinducer synthase, partial [Pseudomonadota bacterium]